MLYNPFIGRGKKHIFAIEIYKKFITRDWVSLKEIWEHSTENDWKESNKYSMSSCPGYGELKKAFSEIKKAINETNGKKSFEEDGKSKNKKVRYIGDNDDPLADLRQATVSLKLQDFNRFCLNSAGFFPKSWLEYFFKDCNELLNIKSRLENGEQVLSASIDRELKNIELLPYLYEAIVNRQVLSIRYQPYGKKTINVIIHPQYLKEYNGRWFLFGHEKGYGFNYNLPIDRMVDKPKEVSGIQYVCAPSNYYNNFFKDIVGVSKLKEFHKTQEIRIRAHTEYFFYLTETKKLHTSQKTILPFNKYKDGEYGEFSVNIKVNNEFIGRILQMGAGLEIVAPDEIRTLFKKRVQELLKLYEFGKRQ